MGLKNPRLLKILRNLEVLILHFYLLCNVQFNTDHTHFIFKSPLMSFDVTTLTQHDILRGVYRMFFLGRNIVSSLLCY